MSRRVIIDPSQAGAQHMIFSNWCDQKVTPDFGRKLLAVIGATPDLQYLVPTLQKTLELLRQSPPLKSTYFHSTSIFDLPISEAIRTIERIVSDAEEIVLLIGPHVCDSMTRTSIEDPHPLNGRGLTLLPYMAHLFYGQSPSSNPNDRAAFARLQDEISYLLLASGRDTEPEKYFEFIRAWQESGQRKGIVSHGQGQSCELIVPNAEQHGIYLGCLEARRLSHPAYESVARELASREVGVMFPDRLSELLLKGRAFWKQDMFRLLSRLGLLLEIVCPCWLRPGETRHYGEKKKGGSRRTAAGDGYVRVGPNLLALTVELDDGESVTKYFQTDGGVAFDQEIPVEDKIRPCLAIGVSRQPGDTQPPSVATLRASQKLHQLKRADACHPLSWRYMTPQESIGLRELLHHHIGNDDAIALIKWVLATGRWARSISPIPVRQSATDSDHDEVDVVYLRDLRAFRIRLAGPRYSTSDHRPHPNEISVSSHLIVPDLVGFWRSVEALSTNEAGCIALSTAAKTAENLLELYVGERVTLSMVSHHLFTQLNQISSGDFGIATLMTGRMAAHSATTNYYSTPTLDSLVEQYKKALAVYATTDDKLDLAPMLGNAGAREMPTTASVAAMWGALKSDMRPGPDYIRSGNAYVAYTIAAITAGVGYRPVVSPEFLDWVLSPDFVNFWDKARSDYHRRFSVLPPSVMRHLVHYSRYRRHIGGILQVQGKKNPAALFLYLDLDGRAQPFRPIHFEQISATFGLPLYALRRYMRARLVAGGHSLEDINAWMGHWHEGLSPFDQLSAYQPKRLQTLALHVDEVLTELGFEARAYARRPA